MDLDLCTTNGMLVLESWTSTTPLSSIIPSFLFNQTLSHTKMSETITTSIGTILDNFTGRRDDPEYEARKTKTYRIHRRNRAYVWHIKKRQRFLDSIHRGYHIPPITVHESTVTDEDGVPRTIREIMDGGNRITTARLIDTGRVGFEVTPEDKAALRAASLTVVVLRGLPPAEQREMFRRMNDPTKVSPGQLFAMSDDTPLVQEALAFIEDASHTLRDLIDHHFPNITRIDKETGRRKDSDGRTILANTVGIVSGLLYGPHYITTSYDRQEEVLLEPVHRPTFLRELSKVLDILEDADAALGEVDKRTLLKQWNLGFILGPLIYDIKTTEDLAATRQKWKAYIIRVRVKSPNAEEALTKLGGGNNLTATRLLRMSKRVDKYLEDGTLLSKEELKLIHHIDDEGDHEEEEDEEDRESTE